MACAGYIAKEAAYNASVKACESHGSVTGLILQMCESVSSAAVGRRRTASNPTAAEEYAEELRSHRRRRGLSSVGQSAIRVFNFIAALSAPLDDMTLGAALRSSRVAQLQADCYAALTPTELAAPTAVSTTASQGVPWGLDRIDARRGPPTLDGQYDAGLHRGSNSTIYIGDTGVRISHEDFGGRAVAGWSAYCNDEDTTCGRAGVAGGVITADHIAKHGICNGHGTHVASTAAGSRFGVAQAAEIVAVQALNCYGGGTTAGIIGAIQWSMEDAVAKGRERSSIISLSLTSNLGSLDKAAVVQAHKAGIVVLAAAGNAAYDQCEWSYLFGFIPEVIVVGSTDRRDAISSFSNFGACVDVFAPGSNVEAAWVTSDAGSATLSGTSMATPHVAGAVALIRTMRPELDADQVAEIVKCTSTADIVSGLPPSYDESARTPNRLLYAGAALEIDAHLNCANFPPLTPPPPIAPPMPPFSPHMRPCKCTGMWPCYNPTTDSCSGGSPELNGANHSVIIAYCKRSGNVACLRQSISPPPRPPSPPRLPAPSPKPPPSPPTPRPPGYTSTCDKAVEYYGIDKPICTCDRVMKTIREACICGYDPQSKGCCNLGCGLCGEDDLALDCGERPPLPPAPPPPPPRNPGYTATCAAWAGSGPICTCDRVHNSGSIRDACICGNNPLHDGCCNTGCGHCGEGELELFCGERNPLPPAPPPAPPSLPGASCCATHWRFGSGWMTTANCRGTSDDVFLEGGHTQCRYLDAPWQDARCIAACAACTETAHCVDDMPPRPPALPQHNSPSPQLSPPPSVSPSPPPPWPPASVPAPLSPPSVSPSQTPSVSPPPSSPTANTSDCDATLMQLLADQSRLLVEMNARLIAAESHASTTTTQLEQIQASLRRMEKQPPPAAEAIKWGCALGPSHSKCACQYEFERGSADIRGVTVTCQG